MSTARDRNGRRRLPPLADAVVCTLITGVLLLVALSGWTAEQSLRHGHTASAHVTDVEPGRYPTYRVTFTSAGSAAVNAETSFALRGARPGDTIQIVYDPTYPDTVAQVGSLGTAWLQWVGWLAAGLLGLGATTISWRRQLRDRRTRAGRHTSADPRGDRQQRAADQRDAIRRWRPLFWKIVLGQPIPERDHAFALDQAQNTVDRLPQSWLGYLGYLVALAGTLSAVIPVAQPSPGLRLLTATCVAIALAGLAVGVRVQWWHRRNRPPTEQPDRP